MKMKMKLVCPNNNSNGVFVKLTGRELLCLRNDSTHSHGTYILGLFFGSGKKTREATPKMDCFFFDQQQEQ